MSSPEKKERWNSRTGVILAVAGSAVGLGNFLRFPGLAVQYGGEDGGGAFMVAYFISLLIIGIPICWAEWTMGRFGGQQGFNSSPGIFSVLIKHPMGKYIGVLGVIIPVMIYMYYVYIEAWCLGYAVNFLTGGFSELEGAKAYSDFWGGFIGIKENGSALGFQIDQVGVYLVLVFALNFFLIFRGLSKGIEWFCKYAMPTLVALAIVILIRVLTLGTPNPDLPDQNIMNGLGFMWNPGAFWNNLKNPQLWLAAAGQIFFSLSVGFGVIITYSSYLRKKDDVVLSGLTATSANEFCEVGLGGMITVPAAYVFFGTGIIGMGTFGVGFNVLPLVFNSMPGGQIFGFLFFFLLFLAAVTSSLSMLQPGIAFLEEGLGINRKQSVTMLGLITAFGCGFVVYFSKDIKALDTIDFWVGTFLIFVLATIEIIIFGWFFGIEKGFKEAHKGSEMRIPNFFRPIMKYICPLFLVVIMFFWVLMKVFGYSLESKTFERTGYVKDLIGGGGDPANSVAQISVAFIAVVAIFLLLLIRTAGKRWAVQKNTNNENLEEKV
ncbi:sodium-dependent transporter [Verrucomicrobia bacterium]|nr:sodium-dependent transporter [Verrucomicrobiota bacterium]